MYLVDEISVRPLHLEIPGPLQGIERIASNLWWRRDGETRELFRTLNPTLWDAGATPLQILRNISTDPAETAPALRKVLVRFDAYMNEARRRRWPQFASGPIAYFCSEYGLQSRIRLYCGGLGILAGDHCMEASDMGLPFVAVGLLYRRGFFRQLIDRDGRQQHLDPVLDPEECSAEEVPVTISVPLPGRTVTARVWRIAVGTVPVLLLDTDTEANRPEDRLITSQLYTVGREMRICQEAVLGIGGVRVLAALGIEPSVYHLNEGHSALLLLERLRHLVSSGKSFKEAVETVMASSVITIHTPVPEGNERFDSSLIEQVAAAVIGDTKIPAKEILKLGLDSVSNTKVFDMTAFALRLTKAANGVSLLHGRTADKTWRKVGGRRLIGVTNGVHMPTWIGPEMTRLFETHGARLSGLTEIETEPGKNERGRWTGVSAIEDAALWGAHVTQKRLLTEFAGRKIFEQQARYGANPCELQRIAGLLNPEALIVGFSRRFAPYKRGTLLFTDERRLLKLLNSNKRPVQIIFSGKAYPTDRAGQAMLAKIYRKSQSPRFFGKVFVLEDYDMEIAEMLVQGVDVWLNNPRRPMEASGTSGMKAAANGAPNASILDGWWDEAFEGGKGRNGFAIGGRKTEEGNQDARDAEVLYRVLEKEIVPLFYDRGDDGLPHHWIRVMKNSIADSLSAFSTRRMIEDYVKMYGIGL